MNFKDEKLSFTWSQMKRLDVLMSCSEGKLSAYDAGEMLGVSRRQIFRLKKKLRKLGPSSVFHANRGKSPHNKFSPEVKRRVFAVFDEWRSKTDLGVNCAHLEDILRTENIQITQQTLWRWLRATGRRMPLRSWKKHRKARERSKSEGQILFLDGSEHPWFGRAYPNATLILCTDDATSRALYGVFVQYENLAGCFEVAHSVFAQYGLPHCFYLDRASQFKTTRKRYDGEDVIAPPTRWQEALAVFGVRCIFAYSPQARGRGERINGTFQGRLAAEFQYRGIHDLREATRYLNETFIPSYNAKFSVKAKARPVWRAKPTRAELNACLAIKETRLVGNDNCVWFEKKKYQILPAPKAYHVARATIEIRKAYDGSITIVHGKYGVLPYQVTRLRKSKGQPAIELG